VGSAANAGSRVSWMRCCRTSVYARSDALQHWGRHETADKWLWL